MMRQASSRNQRNKGLRLNNFLQICILTLVFFWLLYQLKHSFDKKKGPDEQRSRSLNNAIDSHSEFVVLGRKALPHDQGIIVSEGKVNNEDKENEEEGESRHTMDDEEVKEIPEDGIDELDNEQEDEQDDQERGDEEPEDGDDAVSEEEKDEQVEEAEFLDDQDPEESHEKGYKNEDEFSSLHRNNRVDDDEQPEKSEKGVEAEGKTGRRNAGDNSTIAEENYIDYNNSLTTSVSGSSIEKMEQRVSPIDHSKLEGNLLTAGVLDIQADRQTNETLGMNKQPSSTRQ